MSCTAFTSKTLTNSANSSGPVTSTAFVTFLTQSGGNNFVTINVSGNRMTNILVTAISDVSLSSDAPLAAIGTIQIAVVPSGDPQTAYVSNGSQTTAFSILPGQLLSATSQVLVNVPSGFYDIYASVIVEPAGGGTAAANGSITALAVRTNI
jgi:hypothetical protein